MLGSRSSVNDDATPQFHASGDAIEFFPEVLGKDPWELARLFEQWNCKREKSKWWSRFHPCEYANISDQTSSNVTPLLKCVPNVAE
jgi:hypothetical protein